ncbi:MAG: transporter [Clostridiales bacterium]|jgi:4,5-DOPA dioxygenase extradiol|nr:transporter [Clostridiales bacterium]
MIPTLFISHGSPTLAVEENEYTDFLKELGNSIKPKAIVVFTAHWENEVTTISSRDDAFDMIYDFGGFDRELYEIKYPVNGSSKIAALLKSKLDENGIPSQMDYKRGLDHGAWVVLKLMYPEANIPVVQVSINPWLAPEEQFKIGNAIKALKQEDILIIGSGGTVHNLRSVQWGATEPESWAVEFDTWLIEKLRDRDKEALFNYEKLAPHAKMAVPRGEHFAPFFISLGSGFEENEPKLLHTGYNYGTLSHICFEF